MAIFESGFFRTNRRSLGSKLEAGALVVVTANGLVQRSGDTTYPFRQESNFFYLTGIEEPDLVLVMQGNEEFLILPKRSEVETIFGGSINCDEIAKISGVMTIYSHAEGWERYKKLQQDRKIVHTLGAAPAKVAGIDSFYTNPMRRHFIQKLKRLNKHLGLQDLRPVLGKMRQIKQPEEVEAIKRAIAITAEGFAGVQDLLKNGANEFEAEALFDGVFKKNQARHGYQPIVAGGKRACVLHYIQNDQPLSTEELCLVDVGAEWSNYSADITRTYAVKPNTRQKAVIEAVKRAQASAITLLKPGLQWKEYAKQTNQLVGEELVALGLLPSPTSEGIRKYFPHGIGHSLGLDVHDVCDYKVIQENMVITVEPGIYIPEEGIGVRIEDDVLITKDGAVNLSADIPYWIK